MKSELLDYEYAGLKMSGVMMYDESRSEPVPGVVVAHTVMGITPKMKQTCRALVDLGYSAFALDLYGRGERFMEDRPEAFEAMYALKADVDVWRGRAKAGLEVFAARPEVDASRIAAIGYCMGGSTVLELGRSGAELKGIVSFHGGLDSKGPEDAKNIKASVLVLHGHDDPSVPPSLVLDFQTQLTEAGVDWQLVSYGHTVHAFTHRSMGNDNSTGFAYNEKADARSWQAMQDFLQEIFGLRRAAATNI